MRNSKIVLIIGGRGTGKTTYLENLLAGKGLICELFVTDRYKGFKTRKRYEEIKLSDCVNTTIVLEDATQLLAATSTKFLKQLIVSSKQLGSDVFCVFHSVNFVPVFLLAMFDYIVFFPSEQPQNKYALAAYREEIIKILRKKGKKYKPLGVLQNI